MLVNAKLTKNRPWMQTFAIRLANPAGAGLLFRLRPVLWPYCRFERCELAGMTG